MIGTLLAPIGSTPAGEVPGPGKRTVWGEGDAPARNTSEGRIDPLEADAVDNPDQGRGWQVPGTKARKKPPPTPAFRRGEPLDKDAADNPDQGQGWQVPGTKARKKPPAPPASRRGEPLDKDAADNPDQGQGWQVPDRGRHQ